MELPPTLTTDETLYGLISDRASSHPSAPALLGSAGDCLTYQQLNKIVDKARQELFNYQLGAQSRVAIVMPNGLEMALAVVSVMSSMTCVPLNPDYRQQEFQSYLKKINIDALILTPGEAVASKAAAEIGIPIIELKVDLQSASLTLAAKSKPILNGNGFKKVDSNDVALLLHTSGSTASPKVVPLTHRNLLVSAKNVADSLQLTSNDRSLNMLPLFHVGAIVDLILAPMTVGGSAVVTSDMSAMTFFSCLKKFQPSWYQGVPTMLQDLVSRAPGAINNSSLRFIRSVSSPLPVDVLKEVERHFDVPVIEIYGMTETSGLICSNPMPPAQRRQGSVGLVSGPAIKIIDSSGKVCAPDEQGEVLIAGENVMRGYESIGSVNEQFFIDGWFRSGDLGHVDEQGYLFLTGRIKEIINRGGEKISPREIDEAALQHPDIIAAAAFALPHKTLGEEVALAAVLSNKVINKQELRDFLSKRLSHHKVPKQLFFVDELPKGGSGKLLRHKLRELCVGTEEVFESVRLEQPETETAKMLCELWQDVIEVPQVSLHDNFFELGGDSLDAAMFVKALEAKEKITLPVSALFDAPTVAEFEQLLLRLRLKKKVKDGAYRHGDPMLTNLYAYLAWWRGYRLSDESMLIGQNILGSQPPLFWCFNGSKNLYRVAKVLGSDQPVYGMRTLWDIDGRGPENNARLADYYTKEILTIQSEGNYRLFGFCEGGKIMLHVAKNLQALGKTVSLLCLQDAFVPEQYEGSVALFFSKGGKYSAYSHYHQPEIGWRKYYSGNLYVSRIDCKHRELFFKPQSRRLMNQIKALLDREESGTSRKQIIGVTELAQLPLQHLTPEACLARLSLPRFLYIRPGKRKNLSVKITNASDTTWFESARSGITLADRWIKQSKVMPRSDGYAPLPSLKPGESVYINLHITAPKLLGFWQFEVDLVEQGIRRFHEVGSKPIRRVVLVFSLHGLMNFMRRLAGKINRELRNKFNKKGQGVSHV